MADYPTLKLEHTKQANKSSLQNKDSIVWEHVLDELIQLQEIIACKDKSEDYQEGQGNFPSPPWTA